MFKYIKSILMHHPCDVAKAYIAALEKDPTRIGQRKWAQVKSELWEHISLKDRVWVRDQETQLKQKAMIVKMAVLELTNEDESEDNKKAGQIGLIKVNHSILTANQRAAYQQAAYQQAQMNNNLMAHNYNTNAAPW